MRLIFYFLSLGIALLPMAVIAAPIHDAARKGDINEVSALLASGADINAFDPNDLDPLTIAARRGDISMVRLLLQSGADPTAIVADVKGTALIASSHRGYVEIVDALIAAGAPLDHVNNLGWTALLEAVILGDGGIRYQKIVRSLLNAGADATIPDNTGRNALNHARNRGQTQVLHIIETYLER